MNKLKLIRLSRNLTQHQLSDLAKIPQYKISMMENNKYVLSGSERSRLSKALTGDPNQLFESIKGDK